MFLISLICVWISGLFAINSVLLYFTFFHTFSSFILHFVFFLLLCNCVLNGFVLISKFEFHILLYFELTQLDLCFIAPRPIYGDNTRRWLMLKLKIINQFATIGNWQTNKTKIQKQNNIFRKMKRFWECHFTWTFSLSVRVILHVMSLSFVVSFFILLLPFLYTDLFFAKSFC